LGRIQDHGHHRLNGQADLLRLRASILAGEISRLAQEARLEGDHERYAELKAAGRELPHDKARYNDSLDTVRSRLTPEVGAAMRPRIEAEAEQKAASHYQARTEALDLREAGMDHQPKARTPWVLAGAAVAAPATMLLQLLT
jgi:hypothetical protein